MVIRSRAENYEAISQVCQTDQDLSFGKNTSDGAQLVRTLKKLMPLGGNFAFSCQLANSKKDCSQILHPMLTGDEQGRPRTKRKPDTGKPYLNEKLQIHQWGDTTIKKVTRDKWYVRGGVIQKAVDMMVTPRVVEEVRRHFNCEKLEGAELEDQGGEGTALTHWEKRIFENEAMTGTHTQSPVFSRITLVLMEDSGWYRANYSMATPLTWGKNLGCDFVMRSCKEWIAMNHAK